jgi:hypothetical protein
MTVSIALLQLLAKAHVQGTRNEKRNNDSYKNEVAHNKPNDGRNSSGSVN